MPNNQKELDYGDTRGSCITIIVSTKNATITLDKEVATWARIRAAEPGSSVSRLVGGMLKEKTLEEETYKTSMQQYVSPFPRSIKEPGTKYPCREKLHER